MAIILKIGDVDLSGYTLQGQVKVNRTPVYSDQSFKNVKGVVRKRFLGWKFDLSADFGDLPKDVVSQIMTACENDVSITFLDPNETTATFERPSVSSAVEWESDEDTQFWSVSLSATCPLLGDGL